MTRVPNSAAFRKDIQGLRAIAIALVVLAHAGVPGLEGGFVGVDVFFVLSGYLITGLLIREHLIDGRVRYGRFLTRRLRRLLPALVTMLVIVVLAASVLLTAYENRMQTGSFPFAVTWTSNFFFALAEFDYFEALRAKDLFLHTWSLGVEEQFYVVWPWLIMSACAFLTGPHGREQMRRRLLVGFSAVLLASFALCLYWASSAPLLGFYMMPARGWQFALGALVYLASYRVGSLLGALGLLLIVGAAVVLHEQVVYPGHYALLPSLGAALILAAGGHSRPSLPSRVIAGRAFVWIGDRSYSLYLWHWPVLLLGDIHRLTDGIAGKAMLIGASLLLSIASYRFVERPFWKGRFSQALPGRTVLVSTFAMVAAIGVSQALVTNRYGTPNIPVAHEGYDPRMDAPAIYTAGFNCDTGHFSAELNPCGFGKTDAYRTAVLLGDSIGAQWASMLPEIFSAPDWQVTVLTKSACAIVDEDYYYDKVGGVYEVCATWRNAALRYLEELKPDFVFVGSSANYAFDESQWKDGSARVLKKLSDNAGQVVVIPGTPSLSFDGPSCLDEPYRFSFRLIDSRRECEEALADARSDRVSAYLAKSANAFPNVYVMDLNDLVCPNRRCAARQTTGITVFRDQQHLTDSFVVSAVPAVRSRLKALGVDL